MNRLRAFCTRKRSVVRLAVGSFGFQGRLAGQADFSRFGLAGQGPLADRAGHRPHRLSGVQTILFCVFQEQFFIVRRAPDRIAQSFIGFIQKRRFRRGAAQVGVPPQFPHHRAIARVDDFRRRIGLNLQDPVIIASVFHISPSCTGLKKRFLLTGLIIGPNSASTASVLSCLNYQVPSVT